MRKVAEEGGFVFAGAVRVFFGVLTFAPLGASFATVYELSANGCLTLKKRVGIGEVDSEGSASDIHIIEISDSR